MKIVSSEKARHLVVRVGAGERIPDALVDALQEHAVCGGWLRASGVLTDVELRSFGGGPHATRRIAGRLQLLSLEGSVGFARKELSVGMRAIIARETDRGLDMLAGELVTAKVVALEGLVTALDDVTLERRLDPASGTLMLAGDAEAEASLPAPSAPAASSPSIPRDEPSIPAAVASEPSFAAAPRPALAIGAPVALPPKPVRRAAEDIDGVFPEAGDEVQHFAFGRCEVLKSDGDRLHLRVGKDGKIREIALEVLRVQLMPTEGDKRLFRLDRKL